MQHASAQPEFLSKYKVLAEKSGFPFNRPRTLFQKDHIPANLKNKYKIPSLLQLFNARNILGRLKIF